VGAALRRRKRAREEPTITSGEEELDRQMKRGEEGGFPWLSDKHQKGARLERRWCVRAGAKAS